jgi:hypothetical protein
VDSQQRLELWQQDRERLVLRAPIDGTVFAPPTIVHDPSMRLALTPWNGTPLDAENIGATIRVGQMICWIGDPNLVRATVYISQSDVASVRRGQQVVLRIDQLPDRLFRGDVVDLSIAETQEVPVGLANRLGMPQRSSQKPTEILYQATIHFDLQDAVVLQGMTGYAKISTDPRTAAYRIAQFFSKHFTLN